MKRMRIGTRLGLGFGAILAALVVLVAIVLVQLSSMANRVNVLADVGVKELVGLNEVATAISARGIAARHLVLEAEAAKQPAYLDQIKKASLEIDHSLTALKTVIDRGSSSNNAQMRTMLGGLRDTEQRYLGVVASIADAVATGRRAEAAEKLLKECKPIYEQINQQARALEAEVEKATNEHAAKANAAYETARWTTLGAAVAILLVGSFISWGLTRSIVDPIREAVDAAKTVASGDLTKTLRISRQDETGDLLSSLNAMTGNLSKVVSGVRQASDAIAIGAGQIASGNGDLSQRTETQASSLQETAASMEQINTTVRHNAETASQAAALARDASVAAERGGSAVGQVVSTMEDINQSSRKVVDIIAVIDGIAFQTNILALNAAVEAARAGEQGRGFAVVAGEVRVLAQRSAAAAKEIKQLIANSADRVDEGTRLVADAGSAMDDILAQVRRVSDLIEGINQSTVEQTAGISQVNSAVAQLDQATQQNAALVEESAAAAESLRQQARHLVDAVGAFRLPMDAVSSSVIARAASTAKAHAPTPRATPARSSAGTKTAPAPVANDGDWDHF